MNSPDPRKAIAEKAERLDLQFGSVKFELIRIQPGDFEMGSASDEPGHLDSEEPIRHVKISRSFYLGRFEVTQAQFREVMGTNPSRFHGDLLPVDQVNYPTALEFCRRLSQAAGLRVTLPTEAQWEYSCRAGTRSQFYSGNTRADLDRVAWYRENSQRSSHPVGSKEPNAWGLYDMLGNVWELCLDLNPSYETMSDANPVGKIDTARGGMRGGGWMSPAEDCRCARRSVSHEMFGGAGIRIAINP